MSNYKLVSNSGSAIGEAIGHSMENALEKLLLEVANEYGYHYLTSGVRKTKSGKKAKKLLMFDQYGNEYDIDGVLANESMQPLILFESKYIRYKKHNRDKGSWICTAHSAVRRRYESIRSSIAVLAGNWSFSSQTMMRSNDINLFLIPFNYICEILAEFEIDYNWDEKDKEKAKRAWYNFNELTSEEKALIGDKIIGYIKNNLVELIHQILDDSMTRVVEKVLVEVVSNLGEVKIYEFKSIEETLDFLQSDQLTKLFLQTGSLSLFDPPPQLD